MAEKNDLCAFFGRNVFSDAEMRKRLPADVYRSLKDTINNGRPLGAEVAQAVANAMKEWALEQGATHFTHWFQPLTGITAEKHDAFLSPGKDGKAILEFSGKELIKGESDASSFPTAGIRATFEARGYTAWDPTSPAFIKDDTLYIPTAFCSFFGDSLDKKTPLLRSIAAVSKQALRLARLMGVEATRVYPTVGAEQEYFLVDRKAFEKRRDLVFCGRTLFGAKPPKGQELGDHYFGNIDMRVSEYMKELDRELWELGVYAKTKHNEAAPAQYELAPVYTDCNIASDHNQLTMELMKKVALKHGMVCLLGEKPFDGVNGSGKHNNWSLMTDTGINLFKPEKGPSKNLRFLIFLTAMIEAVDRYGDILRMCVASAGNDLRLGGQEAPPAIVSMYIGEELTKQLESFAKGEECALSGGTLNIGVATLPVLTRDNNDRNRTSPFALTGNKFEFRMPGASLSVAGPNIVLNTIAADIFMEYADRLEKAADVVAEAANIIRERYTNHKRILHNGNSYCEEWVEEAERRGLPNLRTTVEALDVYVSRKALELFGRHGVLSPTEIASRYEIKMGAYKRAICVEAATMTEMARREILPAGLEWAARLDRLCTPAVKSVAAGELLKRCLKLCDRIHMLTGELEEKLERIKGFRAVRDGAQYARDVIIPKMAELRAAGDELETIMPAELWPIPTYAELLFKV